MPCALRNYRGDDFIMSIPSEIKTLLIAVAGLRFDEHDSVRVRAVLLASLSLLVSYGTCVHTDNDGTTSLLMMWTSERYSAVVTVMVAKTG